MNRDTEEYFVYFFDRNCKLFVSNLRMFSSQRDDHILKWASFQHPSIHLLQSLSSLNFFFHPIYFLWKRVKFSKFCSDPARLPTTSQFGVWFRVVLLLTNKISAQYFFYTCNCANTNYSTNRKLYWPLDGFFF